MNKRNRYIGCLAASWLMVLATIADYSASAVAALAPVAAPDSPEQRQEAPAPWSYEGATGPAHWGSLDPAYAKCAGGSEQSPINIELSRVIPDNAAAAPVYRYRPTPMSVINTGHTIQVNDASGRNQLILDGQTYTLEQLHFHKASEHRINGQLFEMEGHLVHRDATGRLAVVAFLIKPGRENPVLAPVWRKLPQLPTQLPTLLQAQTQTSIPLDAPIDLIQLLPPSRKAFRYSGSLTTPPCTEGVKWVVLKQPVELSQGQIAAFGALFPDNHRPVQPLHRRKVTTSP